MNVIHQAFENFMHEPIKLEADPDFLISFAAWVTSRTKRRKRKQERIARQNGVMPSRHGKMGDRMRSSRVAVLARRVMKLKKENGPKLSKALKRFRAELDKREREDHFEHHPVMTKEEKRKIRHLHGLMGQSGKESQSNGSQKAVDPNPEMIHSKTDMTEKKECRMIQDS